MLLSTFLDIDSEDLSRFGVFNKNVDRDIERFLRYEKIMNTSIESFASVANKYKVFFSELWIKILRLHNQVHDTGLSAESHPLYLELVNDCTFKEFRGVGLGYSTSYKNCKGWGYDDAVYFVNRLLVQVDTINALRASEEMVSEFFGMIPFHICTIPNIGPDRTSDMLAYFMKDEMYEYTNIVVRTLENDGLLNSANIKAITYNGNDYRIPFRDVGYPILFIPTDFLIGGFSQEKEVLSVMYDCIIETEKDIAHYLGVDVKAQAITHKELILNRKVEEGKSWQSKVNKDEKVLFFKRLNEGYIEKLLILLSDEMDITYLVEEDNEED